MCQSAERDDINACFCDRADILSGDVSRSFEQSASCCYLYSLLHLVTAHIVEHDYLDLIVESLAELVECADFDLYLDSVTYLLAESRHSARDAAVSVDVVVFEHRAVREIVAVILSAADRYCVLL